MQLLSLTRLSTVSAVASISMRASPVAVGSIDTLLVHQRFGGSCSDCRVQLATERPSRRRSSMPSASRTAEAATTSSTATEGRRRILEIAILREKDAVIADAMTRTSRSKWPISRDYVKWPTMTPPTNCRLQSIPSATPRRPAAESDLDLYHHVSRTPAMYSETTRHCGLRAAGKRLISSLRRVGL